MRIFVVDAFTDKAFRGNPAAVCLLEGDLPDAYLQDLAAEMNLSETAFCDRRRGSLRWFTPTTEVDLCGHATLATAHVLYEDGADGELTFQTRSGALGARRSEVGIELDFPARAPRPVAVPEGLEAALGAEPVAVFAVDRDLLVVLGAEPAVRQLNPDLVAVAAMTRGLIVTAPGGDGCDFVSRFFAPAVGIPEDPVTGSAHCALGPYWAGELGKHDLVGYQASRRGGWVHVGVRGARILLGGVASTVLRGEVVSS